MGAARLLIVQAVVIRDVPELAVLAAYVQPGRAQGHRAVQVVAVGQLRLAGIGVERPAQGAIRGVERIQPAVAIAEVDDPARPLRPGAQGRRRADRVAGVILPEQFPIRVHGVERAVRRAEQDGAGIPLRVCIQRGRSIDVVGGGELPLDPAGLRVERIQVRVEAADVDRAVRADGRRGGDKSQGPCPPDLVPIRGHRADIGIQRAPVDTAVVANGRHGPVVAVGRVGPLERAVRVDGVIQEVGVAGIIGAVEADRHVALEPAVIADLRAQLGLVDPDGALGHLHVAGLEVVHVPIARSKGNGAGRQGAGQIDDLAGLVLPVQGAIRVEGVEEMVGRAEIDPPVCVDHRRGEDALAGLEAPGFVPLVHGRQRAGARVASIPAEGGPGRLRLDGHIVAIRFRGGRGRHGHMFGSLPREEAGHQPRSTCQENDEQHRVQYFLHCDFLP